MEDSNKRILPDVCVVCKILFFTPHERDSPEIEKERHVRICKECRDGGNK